MLHMRMMSTVVLCITLYPSLYAALNTQNLDIEKSKSKPDKLIPNQLATDSLERSEIGTGRLYNGYRFQERIRSLLHTNAEADDDEDDDEKDEKDEKEGEKKKKKDKKKDKKDEKPKEGNTKETTPESINGIKLTELEQAMLHDKFMEGYAHAMKQKTSPSDWILNPKEADTKTLKMIPFGKQLPREENINYIVATSVQECLVCQSIIMESYVLGNQYANLFGYLKRDEVNTAMGMAQVKVLQACPEFINDWCYQDMGGTQALRAPCPSHLKCHYCLGLNPLHCMQQYNEAAPWDGNH